MAVTRRWPGRAPVTLAPHRLLRLSQGAAVALKLQTLVGGLDGDDELGAGLHVVVRENVVELAREAGEPGPVARAGRRASPLSQLRG